MHQLTDFALEAGRKWQSPQTGFIHYCHYVAPSDRQDMIPTRENFLFALALLRSRVAENVAEAKLLLERLLSCQGPTGNFPVHLHESPYCYDRWHGASLLATFHWIIHDFHSVLGSELLNQLKKAFKALLKQAMEMVAEVPPDYPTMVQIAAAAAANGEREGEALLAMLAELGPQPSWYCSRTLGEMAVALQMVYPSLTGTPWSAFGENLHRLWYAPLQCYGGPAFDEREWGAGPLPTLYTFLMGSRGAEPELPEDLQAVLVRPRRESCPVVSESVLQGAAGAPWSLYFGEHYAYAAIRSNGSQSKGCSPFRLLWGTPGEVRSLVCQGGQYSELEVNAVGNKVEFLFSLGEWNEGKPREVAFYCSHQKGLRLRVDGEPSTVFHLGQRVSFESRLKGAFTFELVEGDGDFVGHLMLGNRPAQLIAAFPQPIPPFDWQIFLRTVRRSDTSRIRVILEIDDAAYS